MWTVCSRALLVAAALFIVATAAITLGVQTEKVYLTKTGTKYHGETSRSPAKLKIETTAGADHGAIPAEQDLQTAGTYGTTDGDRWRP